MELADPAHEKTDDMIEEIRQRVSREYLRAYEETEAKLGDYLSRFEAKDRIHREAVKRGEETQADYAEWRKGQILVGKRWREMVGTLAEDYRNADRVAASIVNGYTPDAYALNHDYATFQVERGSRIDTSYTLYDRATVERLLRDRPDLLPAVRVDGKRDLAWNRRHVVSAVTQGVLQGESLDKVARRIRSVADMDCRASMRTARTAMTSAQNAGRVDAYRRAGGMGIRVRKQWLATLDGRTRHSHRALDGEVVDMDEEFSNGLRYPGDPSGAGSEVYNCRCTLVPDLPDYPAEEVERANRLGGMSYEEWRNGHAATPEPGSHTVAQGRDIVGKWKRRADQFDFEIEDVMAAQGYDGVPRLVDADEFDELVKQANGGQGFVAQRSYTGTSKEVADEYRRTLYEGKWYVDCSTGGAQYGQGMYCAADYAGKLTDGIKAEMDHYTSLGKSRSIGSKSTSYVETMTLDSSAKVITYDDLMDYVYKDRIEKRLFREATGGMKFSEKELAVLHESILQDATPEQLDVADNFFIEDRSGYYAAKKKLQSMADGIKDKANSEFSVVEGMDPGAIAALHGYDAINAEGHGDSGSYTVVLNRTKLIIKRPEGWR